MIKAGDPNEEGGPVNVRYVDLDGKEISPTETIKGKYNAPYEIEPKPIAGYTFVKDVDNNRKGNFPKQGETITVTLQYKAGDPNEEGGPVNVRYVDHCTSL